VGVDSNADRIPTGCMLVLKELANIIEPPIRT